jgi:hypothetical protein
VPWWLPRDRRAGALTECVLPLHADREGWDATVGDDVELAAVLYFDCPEDVLVGRIIKRGEQAGPNGTPHATRAWQDGLIRLMRDIQLMTDRCLPASTD